MTVPAIVPAVFERVCALIETGDTIKVACQKEGVSVADFRKWRLTDPQAERRLAHAEELGYEAQADDLAHIHEAIPDPRMARVVSENRRWLLAQRAAKRYGPKAAEAPIQGELVDVLKEAIARIPRPVSDQPTTIEGTKPTLSDIFSD